ncbi:MAG: hypothetical protein ACFN4T_07110 [Peptidiphaga sp.]
MPDGMDGTRREALREALRRRECERGGGGPDFETVRRRVAASPSPLDRRGWTAARSLRLAASLAWAQLRIVPWLVLPLALLTATLAALAARFFSVNVGARAAVAGFSSLVLFGVNLTVTAALSRLREDSVCLATPVGPRAVVLARVAAVLALDAAAAVAASAWGAAGSIGAMLAGWLVPMAAVAGAVAFLAIWTAPWAGVVVGMAVIPLVGPSSSPIAFGPPSGSLQEAITPFGVVALGLALIAAAALSSPSALASQKTR